MIIECDTCPVRGQRCDGCMVSALQALPTPTTNPWTPQAASGLRLDAAERRAVQLLVDAGLVRSEQARSVRAQVEPRGWQASG